MSSFSSLTLKSAIPQVFYNSDNSGLITLRLLTGPSAVLINTGEVENVALLEGNEEEGKFVPIGTNEL